MSRAQISQLEESMGSLFGNRGICGLPIVVAVRLCMWLTILPKWEGAENAGSVLSVRDVCDLATICLPTDSKSRASLLEALQLGLVMGMFVSLDSSV